MKKKSCLSLFFNFLGSCLTPINHHLGLSYIPVVNLDRGEKTIMCRSPYFFRVLNAQAE